MYQTAKVRVNCHSNWNWDRERESAVRGTRALITNCTVRSDRNSLLVQSIPIIFSTAIETICGIQNGAREREREPQGAADRRKHFYTQHKPNQISQTISSTSFHLAYATQHNMIHYKLLVVHWSIFTLSVQLIYCASLHSSKYSRLIDMI